MKAFKFLKPCDLIYLFCFFYLFFSLKFAPNYSRIFGRDVPLEKVKLTHPLTPFLFSLLFVTFRPKSADVRFQFFENHIFFGSDVTTDLSIYTKFLFSLPFVSFRPKSADAIAVGDVVIQRLTATGVTILWGDPGIATDYILEVYDVNVNQVSVDFVLAPIEAFDLTGLMSFSIYQVLISLQTNTNSIYAMKYFRTGEC